MRHSTFFWFVLPTASAMVLFIAFPIISVLLQSVHAPHPAVLVEVETCTPLVGCTVETTMDQDATKAIREAEPLGRFIGLEIFFDRGHLAVKEVGEIIKSSNSFNEVFNKLSNLPFYRALAFTLTFTFIVTPFVIIFGFLIAITVNAISSHFKGLVIFFSLLLIDCIAF